MFTKGNDSLIIRNDMELAAAKQLGIDLNCGKDCFFLSDNTVTAPKLSDGKRLFTEQPNFFRAATMGMGTVICAAEPIRPYAQMLASQMQGTVIFSAAAVSAINRELFSHGQCIGICSQYYLPKTPYKPVCRKEGYIISVFEGQEIEELYQYKGFSNALLYRTDRDRHDILAVCAVNGRRVMGIAGASSDSPTMAQIGIDVLPEFRGMGIGSALVSACAAEVFRSGYIPYYGTWCGNIISQKIAAACGFVPAWCEMFSVPLSKASSISP